MSSVPDKNRKMKNMKKCMNFDCNKLYICVLKVISRHMERIIEMSIENCRAIKKADIELNGITVVSGINGCGKTTMSKMLYYIFKNTNDFESLAVSFFRSKVRKYCGPLDQALRIYHDSNQYQRLEYMSLVLSSWNEELELLKQVHETATELTTILSQEGIDKSSTRYLRLIKIFQDVLDYKESDSLEYLISLVEDKIQGLHNLAEEIWNKRPYHVLRDALQQYFPETNWDGIKVKEYGSYIMEDSLDTAIPPHFIQKVVYIDSPMTLKGPTRGRYDYYAFDLIRMLEGDNNRHQNIISDIIKHEIIKGEAYFDQDTISKGFLFRDSRGRTFNLNECATGVRSFSIIQMLLDNGIIDENCLLIIDEPEAHLHPQWIVEYARMIVLLRKTIKAKFFIASHSTDMVEALRSLSDAEGIESDLRYYLGEEEGESGSYIFRDLGLDIEPIFASFNKSFDRLEYYTSKEE